jgi:uncharacterized protein with PIN domain
MPPPFRDRLAADRGQGYPEDVVRLLVAPQLRFLLPTRWRDGVDTAYRNDASDDELVEQAGREDRLLLTQDRGMLRRRAVRRAAYVRGSSPDDQLADVLARFRLPLAPYT